MNKSNLFKLAHILTKATIQAGDSYSATFAICLKVIYAESKTSKPDALVGGYYSIVRSQLFGADIHHADKRNTMQLVSLSDDKAIFLAPELHDDTSFEIDFDGLNALFANEGVKRVKESKEARYIKAGLSRV